MVRSLCVFPWNVVKGINPVSRVKVTSFFTLSLRVSEIMDDAVLYTTQYTFFTKDI